MNDLALKKREIDWEEIGFQTMLECNHEENAIEICALHLDAFADHLRPGTSRIESTIEQTKAHALALHNHLYDRPIPVEDASMLTHTIKIRIVLVLVALTAVASLGSNFGTFWLWGWRPVVGRRGARHNGASGRTGSPRLRKSRFGSSSIADWSRHCNRGARLQRSLPIRASSPNRGRQGSGSIHN